MRHYTIYQTTNTVNGKVYVGKHITKDPADDYLGSGKNIRRAIKKYGRDKFTKQVLHVFNSEDEMNLKEKELVTEEFCSRADTYNICEGGKGGFGWINANLPDGLFGKRPLRLEPFVGLPHSETTKAKIGAANKMLVGSRNSQFGTMWITNGVDNKKVKREQPVDNGWFAGRVKGNKRR